MTAQSRFDIVASLPSPRRHLHVAVDRESLPLRAVVLALYPRTLSDDPGRLARLSAEMERAAQLFHPNVLAPVGIEAVGDDLAAVTIWRDAVTLREVLEAGGRLPPDIAARIAADVCAGLGHAHGRPEPVVHGLLQPEAVLVEESGAAVVAGFGMPGGSSVSDDLLGVGELLYELLAGEPPEDPSAPLDMPGVPEPLAAVVRSARAVEPAERPPTADALAEAISQAVPLAPREAVAAYVEAIVPPGGGLRAERRRQIEAALAATSLPEEISEHDIVGVATPLPGDVAVLEAEATPAPVASGDASIGGEDSTRGLPSASDRGSASSPDPTTASSTPAVAPASTVTTTATPVTAAPETAAPATATPAAAAPAAAAPADVTPAAATPAAATPAAAAPAAAAPAAAAPAAATPATATSTANELGEADRRPVPAHPERGTPRGPRVPLGVAIAMCLGGIAIGFALARVVPWPGSAGAPGSAAAEERAPANEGAPEATTALAGSTRRNGTPARAPARAGSKAAAQQKRASVRRASAPAHEREPGMGLLDVTAPAGAEVWLDDRLIGEGSLRWAVREGSHRVEVRHRGARVGESFQVGPGETWTYVVTPR